MNKQIKQNSPKKLSIKKSPPAAPAVLYKMASVKELEFSYISLEQKKVLNANNDFDVRFKWYARAHKTNKAISLYVTVEFAFRSYKNEKGEFPAVIKHLS